MRTSRHVDGVTWQKYGTELKGQLVDRHDQLQCWACLAKPGPEHVKKFSSDASSTA